MIRGDGSNRGFTPRSKSSKKAPIGNLTAMLGGVNSHIQGSSVLVLQA